MNMLSHKASLFTLVLMASASLSGCVPYYFTDARAVAGQVVSRSTNRPIAGATVSMTADKYSARVQTDQNGGFSLPALRHFGFAPLISDGFVTYGTLRAEAAGYRPYAAGDRLDLPASQPWELDSRLRGPSRPTEEYGRYGDDLKHFRITLTPGA